MSVRPGIIYGVGVGPGDPELMTLKAARIIREANVIAYFAKRGGSGHARRIADGLIHDAHIELPMIYPLTTELPANGHDYQSTMRAFYEESVERIAEHAEGGANVAIISEGDPFLYGSYMHLHHRLETRFTCRVVPGVTAMAGCAANAGLPIAWGEDVLTVLPATLPLAQLREKLRANAATVIMKLGRHWPKIRDMLAEQHLLSRAMYVEYGTMENERIIPAHQKMDEHAPYFSLVLVPGQGRRP